jgi:hypothetical protein
MQDFETLLMYIHNKYISMSHFDCQINKNTRSKSTHYFKTIEYETSLIIKQCQSGTFVILTKKEVASFVTYTRNT